jgi:hypothetical protein
METIRLAAVRPFHDKAPSLIYTGRNHADIIWTLATINHIDFIVTQDMQGFVTDTGRFVDRTEAAKIAFEAGQIKEEKRILFSEDLYGNTK